MNHLPFISAAPRYDVLKKGNGTKCAPFINVVVLKASFFYEDSPLYLQS